MEILGAASDVLLDDALTGCRVLVIDDNPTNVTLLTRLLTGAGLSDVQGVTDSRAAAARIRELDPALVVLDLHMPHVDGFALLAGVREGESGDEHVPVLVMTADVTDPAKQRALALGATDFLTKPFDRSEVLLRVRNLLRMRRLHQRLREHNAELHTTIDEQAATQRRTAEAHARALARVERAFEPQALAMVFQPIADVASGRIVGAEALARFACEPHRPPDEWFAEAADVRRSGELELAAIRAAISHLDRLPAAAFLSINVSADTVMAGGLESALSGVPAERIVLELTEHRRVEDYDGLLRALAPFRSRGVRVAVDDAGAGYSGLQHILRLSPDIIKLDTALTAGIDGDPVRRALAASLCTFAHEVQAIIVAEGIETAEELEVLRRLEVPWGQGYHLARPGIVPFASDRIDAAVPALLTDVAVASMATGRPS